MNSEKDAVELSVQLLTAGGAMLVMTLLHSSGLLVILRGLNLNPERLEDRNVDFRTMLWLGMMGLSLFALHLIEILLFALLYMAIAAIHSFEEALYFSSSTYATLGRPDGFLPEHWRLLGSIEALTGFVLITWSAAFIVSALNELRK